MDERNIICGVSATALSWVYNFTAPLGWLFLLGAVLIVADLRFGIQASRARGEKIRTSRAIRRTINKAIDYICWVLLAGTLGSAFGELFGVRVLPILVMIVIYGVETNSCFSNYFEARGSHIKIDIFKWFAKKMDIIEVTSDEDKQ